MNFFLIFLAIFFNFSLFADHTENNDYMCVVKNQTVDQQVIKMILPSESILLSLSVDADIFVEKEEVLYLLNMQESQKITQDDFIKGLQILSKKERYKEISLKIEQGSDGINVCLKIIGNYVIRDIKIEGIWYGADLYKRLCGLNRYEIFEEEKIKEGVEKIKKYVHAQGYFDAEITFRCSFDEKQKQVIITFIINLGIRYIVQHVSLELDQELLVYKKTIEAIFNTYCTKKLTSQVYTHAFLQQTILVLMNKLKKEGFFIRDICVQEHINSETKKLQCTISLHHMYAHRIIITGNYFFSHHILLSYLQDTFKNEHLISKTILVETLLQYYKQHGFLQIQIDTEEANVHTIFHIKENIQTKIVGIDLSFQNNTVLDESLVKKFLERALLHAPFNEHIIERALFNTIEYLTKQGFLDAHVVEYTNEHTNNGIIVHIILDTKEKCIINNIEIEADEYIKTILVPNLEKISVVSSDFLIQEHEKIMGLLHDAGYIRASVFHEIKKEHNTLIWHIDPGAQVMFDKTVILGNPYISFKYIEQYLHYAKDVCIQKENHIPYILENLQKLAIYERIELYPDIYNISEKRTLFLRLIPDNQFEIRTRYGAELQHIQDYQTFGGLSYKCGFSFIFRNRFKRADVCQFDADFAGSHREIVISQSIPLVFNVFNHFPFSSVWILKAQGYDMRYDQPGVIGYPKNLYTIYRDGILCNLYNSKESSYLNCSVGFEIQKTSIKNKKNAKAVARAIDFDIKLLSMRIPYFFIDVSMMADFLDDKIEPTSGISSLISCKSMIPLQNKQVLFTKLLFEQTFFIPLCSFIIGFRARFGYLFNRSFSKIAPMERFYLGGSHSVRGYEADLFPPIHSFIDNEGKRIYVPRGGKIMFNINLELKKKIIGYLSFVLFHDMGFLADHVSDIQKPVLHTSGFGVRFETPFGPLRFDFGRKWKLLYDHEKRYGWYITFGRAF